MQNVLDKGYNSILRLHAAKIGAKNIIKKRGKSYGEYKRI